MNINVIAEGVEKEEQAFFLKELNCNYVQGYYYSKPIPKCEIEEKIIYNS